MKWIQSLALLVLFVMNSNSLDGQDNTLYGTAAGLNLTVDGIQNSFYGRSAGLNMLSGDENSFFGYQSGYGSIISSALSELADKNSFFGYRSGYSLSFGSENTFMGYHAGYDLTGGLSNSFLGASAGANSTTASFNTFVGVSSGFVNTTGSQNTYIGVNSGQKSTGDDNTFIGVAAGRNIVSGSNNICIGAAAGPDDEESISNRLYIDVIQWDFPLIEGVFDGPSSSPIVKINGEFEVVGPFNGGSDVNLKKDFEVIDNIEILKKVTELDISEWEFKKFDGHRHIGPMAQDFYSKFGLGKGETTISSVDADGVALASIQALYDLLQEEKERNDILEKKVEELMRSIEAED